MKKILKVLLSTSVLVMLMAMTAFASSTNRFEQRFVSPDKLAEGGYSQYFAGTNIGTVVVSKYADKYRNGSYTIIPSYFGPNAGDVTNSWICDDAWNDRWYFLQENGKMATQSGNYMITTSRLDSSLIGTPWPFVYDKTSMYLDIDPSGVIKNLTLGVVENNNLFYQQLMRYTVDVLNRTRGSVPYVYTSQMAAYPDNQAELNICAEMTIEPYGNANLSDFYNAMQNSKRAMDEDARLISEGKSAYGIASNGWFVCDKYMTPELKNDEAYCAANHIVLKNEWDMGDYDAWSQRGIARTRVPSWCRR